MAYIPLPPLSECTQSLARAKLLIADKMHKILQILRWTSIQISNIVWGFCPRPNAMSESWWICH